MAGQGKLFNFCNLIGNYRNVFNNRITVAPCYLQNAGLKITTKEKFKNLKIPEAPKRPIGPFFRFLAEQRPLLLKQHPDWKVADVAKQCAAEWKNVAADIKENYKAKYSEDLQAFEHRNKQYQSSLTAEQSEAVAAAKIEKVKSKERRIINKLHRETNKPKRPQGSFTFFISEKFALPENKGKKLMEILDKYKEEWNSLPNKEKYIKMHKDAADKYNKAMMEWEAKMIAQGNPQLVRKDNRYVANTKSSTLKSSKIRER